jgi:hypothetical protein
MGKSVIKKYFKWYNKAAKKMRWQEITLLKIAVFALALTVANLWRPILMLEWYVYGIIFVAAYAILIYRLEK